jgi:heat-inducible transcriptional repressor
MLELIENPENMTKFFHQENPNKEKLEVLMGEDDDLKDLSVVKTDLNVNGHSIGKIALVGPRRMDYDQVLSALEYVIERFEEVYNDLGEDDKDEERKAS